jgi:hypothetical protein
MASSRPAPYPLATLPRAAPPAAPPYPDRHFLYLCAEHIFEMVLRPGSVRWSHGRDVQCHHHFYEVAGAQMLYMKFHWNGDWARAKESHYTVIHDDGSVKIWRSRGHAEHQFLVELPLMN